MIHRLITFLFVPIFAQLWPNPGPGHVIGAAQTFLVNQNFETPTTGYDNGETWTPSGTVNPAYTGIVLRGTQSLRMGFGGAYTFTTFASQSHVYSYCDWYAATLAGGTAAQGPHLNGGAADTYMEVDGTGHVFLFAGGGATSASATTLSITTIYHVWLEHLNGGTCVLAISASTTKPSVDGSGNVYLTKTGDAGNVDHIYLQNTSTGDDIIMDHALVSTTVIGNNP